jgi:BlaI family penicillinase repressor
MQNFLHKERQMGDIRQLHLSKRERQVMEIVYRRKRVSAKDVWLEIPDFPSYSAVRSVLNILEQKGLLAHSVKGKKYIYFPTIAHEEATHSAVMQLLTTYFDNSLVKAVIAMLEIHEKDLTIEDFERLNAVIARARKEEEENNAPNDT